MSIRSHRLVLAALGAAALLSPTAVWSETPGGEVIVHAPSAGQEVRSETVSFADLDLTGQAGARSLLLRIRGAAKRVCGPEPVHGESATPYRGCVTKAVDGAVTEIDQPTLSALNRHGG